MSEILDRGEGLRDLIRAIAIINTSSVEEGIRRGRQMPLPLLPSPPPACVIPSVLWVRGLRKVLWQVSVEASPARPGVSWGLVLVAIEHSNARVSVFAARFETGSGGQELMMDFLFIYIFILLTGKLEICRVLKQLEKRQVTENRHEWAKEENRR